MSNLEYMRERKLTVTKIVGVQELERYTENGWVLIEILPETMIQPPAYHSRQVVQQAHQGPNGTWIPDLYSEEPPPQIIATHLYLIALDEQSALAQHADQIKRLNEDMREAAIVAKQNDEIIKKRNEEAVGWKNLNDQSKALCEKQIAMVNQLRADISQIKGDDQKLRDQLEKCKRAMGDIQYKKIIEEA